MPPLAALPWSEEWRNATAGVASAATTAAIVVGALWSWRRFRRTPESRAKLDVDVICSWALLDGHRDHLSAQLVVRNGGGHIQMMTLR
jgi:hypothetical protein